MKIPYTILFLILTILTGCKDSNITGPLGSADYKIAFFTDDFKDLHVVDVDGSRDVAITSFFGRGTSVDWFPDGSSLIYSELNIAYPSPDTARVWLYEFGTGQKRLLFSKTMVAFANLTISPDGQMVVCILYHDTGGELTVFNANGSNIRSLTPPDKFVYDCQWSPDGSQIVFVLESKICTVKPDGSQFIYLTDGPGYNAGPSYSPDGTKIIFWSIYEYGLYSISVMNTDGSSEHLITPLENISRGYPKWSPDGKYIAYMQEDTSHVSRIFRMDADGKNEMQLSNGPGSHFSPQWLPDGRIVYISNAGLNLWSVDKDGVQSKQITNNETGGGYLTFAVSRSRIMYYF